METVRINKYIAACGVCSRRDADRLIEEGRVTIDGRTAVSGDKVSDDMTVCVGGKPVKPVSEKVVLAYYKPVGVTCTERDIHAARKVVDEIDYKTRLTYAGRLDKDSEGLLLMTNDGELINKMMKGSAGHEKEYIVRTREEITPVFIENMSKGVFLEEINRKTRPCIVRQNGKYSFNIILTEGVNRQIRRMCSAFGYNVASLKRIRVLSVNLNKLKPGEYRKLSADELNILYKECGIL